MKKIAQIALIALASASIAKAAVTVNISNVASLSSGVMVLDGGGDPIASGSYFVSAGYFGTLPDFNTDNAATIAAAFTPIDSTPVSVGGLAEGLFNAQDYNQAGYPAGFVGQGAYLLVGNNSTLANSTLVAVYDANALYPAVDGAGNASLSIQAIVPGDWVYGNVITPNSQSSLGGGTSIQDGVQLVSVPEPSIAILGSLGLIGLLRRRRR